jgi:DNA modification methylase
VTNREIREREQLRKTSADMSEPAQIGDATLYTGDVLSVLAGLPEESVHCVVTSPPYWNLRDYGTAQWEGGSAECDHVPTKEWIDHNFNAHSGLGDAKTQSAAALHRWYKSDGSCPACGARRIDAQIGLESTPEEYVAKMVEVFRAVRRVLRKDGTLWINLGDSYSGAGYSNHDNTGGAQRDEGGKQKHLLSSMTGLKPKDLVGIPWSVAKALQAPYYTGRIKAERDRVWLAAMLDAEGSICGFDHDRADGDGHRSGIHLQITNSSTAILDEAARIWPTSRSEHGHPGEGHLGTLPTFRWIVHGVENKIAILKELYPYLISKRRQAVVAYSMLLLMADAKRLGHSTQKEIVLAKRAILTALLSDLNHQRETVMPDWLTEPPSLYEPGWYLRSEIIWSKLNPMPESVTDRPTKAHEQMFLLSKSPHYFYDAEAIKEDAYPSYETRYSYAFYSGAKELNGSGRPDGAHNTQGFRGYTGKRNRRTVWTIATEPYPESHFATFPRKLVQPCILAGCPEHACPKCGAPWVKEVECGELVSTNGTRDDYRPPKASDDPKINGRSDGWTPNHMRPSLTVGEHPTCTCGLLSCATCGMVIEYPYDKSNMHSMREGIRIVQKEGEILQSQMPKQRNANGAGESVSGLSENIPAGQESKGVLQQTLRFEVFGEDQADNEGKIQNNQGLRDDLQAGPSNSDEGRLHHGASACDGDGARQISGFGGDRPSQERGQVGQSAGESDRDGQARSRPAQETKMDSDLPSLPPDIPNGGKCPRCRGTLTLRSLPPVPGTVIDIFGGSGTTAEVALEYGRRAILIELKPEYVGLQRKRLAPIAGRPPLDFSVPIEPNEVSE